MHPHRRPRLCLSALAAGLMAAFSPAHASPAGVVISQIYGGNGTLYNADYVELFNAGATPVTMTNWSIQYASATGTGHFAANGITPINTTLQPGQYWLIRLPASGGGGATLSPDQSGASSPNLSASNGKVALLNSAVGLACNGASTPCSAAQLAQIEDLVGYGAANFSEGSAAPAASSSTALLRAGSGCTDSGNNAADFVTAPPAPRNAASPFAVCGGGGAPNQPIVTTCPALSLAQGSAGSVTLTARDADSRVDAVQLTGTVPAGVALGTLTAATVEGDTASVTLQVSADLAPGSHAIGVQFSNDDAQTAVCTASITVAALTRIYDIQGRDATSPLTGRTVSTQGVVSAVNNNGFFMQDETGDGDDSTSDGIFVFTGSAPTVSAGDRVRVSATVIEYAVGTGSDALAHPLTELGGTPAVSVLSSGVPPEPTPLAFPEHVEGDLERYEGMLVRIDGPLTVSQNYFLGRYGQLTVSAGGRLEKPTNRHPAGSAEALAMAEDNARRRLLLDDGSSAQNPAVIPYLGTDNTVRAGDTVDSLTGVIDYGLATSDTAGLSDYRLHPTQTPVFVRANPRLAAPPAVGGNVRIASFNVLNYFTTLDQPGAACYPSGTRSDCRGADSATEFARQKAKIVAAIAALDADVVGLMEIENQGNAAVLDLVAALNAKVGAGTYASLTLPAGGTGTDAIRVALIYQPAVLVPVGDARSDTQAVHNRPPLAQTFTAANGEKFSVIVSHFKSKGSCPNDDGPNTEQGDGQGCWNALRVEQAQALRGFIAALQASTGDPDVIVIGDLNAYGKEDPVLDFSTHGYVDQIARFEPSGYSYVFDGESGYLDHALATPSLSAQIVGAGHWRINADEPSVLDYNIEFKNHPECNTGSCTSADHYAPHAYRSSDHDPVLIGLKLVKTLQGSAGRDTLSGTPGDDAIHGGPGADVLSGGGGADLFVFDSLRDGVDTITDFEPGSDRIALGGVLASLGLGGTDALAAGYLTCKSSGTDALLGVDVDAIGPQASRNLVRVKQVSCATLMVPAHLAY